MQTQTMTARQPELAAVEMFLDEDGPRALLLEGEAGIGKSSVWNAGLEAARERGMIVLAARPAGAEVRLSFAGLSDMLGRLPASAFASLPAPQRRAIDAALLRAEVTGGLTDPRAVGQAVVGVLRTVASDGPIVVAIDDLQWLDPPSGRALTFALRRLVDEPIALLATARMGVRDAPPFGLDRVLRDGWLRRVRIGPLSQGAVHELLRTRLQLNLSRPALLRLHGRAGGNPFFALEIGRLLEGRIEAAHELPLPNSLRELVHERLARLPPTTRRVLLAAAALSKPRLSLLGRTAPADPRPAVDGGIVKLERAAQRASARGAPDAAAELVRLARRLTPGSSVERLLAEAEYTFESGDTSRARTLMEKAVDLVAAGPLRAHARARFAWFRGGWGDDPHGALALLDGAVAQAAGDLAVRAEVFECLTWQSHLVGRHDDAARYARLGAEAAAELVDPRWIALLGLAVALAEGKVGRVRAARAAVARLEELTGAVAHVRVIDDPDWLRAIFLASDGDLEGALALVRPLHERALERGDESSLPNLLEHLALLEFRAGNWQRADELVETASEIAVQTD